MALRATSVLMEKCRSYEHRPSLGTTSTINRHWKLQDDPYRSFPVRPMRLEVGDKEPASSVASNCSLLLRHVHPVYSSFAIPRNQTLFSTSGIVQTWGWGEDNGFAEELWQGMAGCGCEICRSGLNDCNSGQRCVQGMVGWQWFWGTAACLT